MLNIATSFCAISVIIGIAYVLLHRCTDGEQRVVERSKRKINLQARRQEQQQQEARKETFVRVGAETPEDECEDPSPPLAVVQAPLKLGPKQRAKK